MTEVYVTLIGNRIAVSTTRQLAQKVASEMLSHEAHYIVGDADETGEKRATIKIRVCKVFAE